MSQLQSKLQQLSYVGQRKVLIEAARAGAAVALEEVRLAAPRDTGAMADGLYIRTAGTESDLNEGTVEVKSKMWYWFLQRPRFLEPALERCRDRILEAMSAKLSAAIDKLLIRK